jgi:hypothetical protein
MRPRPLALAEAKLVGGLCREQAVYHGFVTRRARHAAADRLELRMELYGDAHRFALYRMADNALQ